MELADYWGCLRIRVGHERMAVHFLTTVSRYEIYQPRFLERCTVRGRKTYAERPSPAICSC